MNPRDFLALADTLIQGSTEAAWRSAVSRAYYASFHVAREFLETLRFRVPHADRAHGYIWLRLANAGHEETQLAGNKLKTLRSGRNRADYDLTQPLHQERAAELVGAAQNIVQLLEQIANDATLQSQITDAIRDYERDVLQEQTWQS